MNINSFFLNNKSIDLLNNWINNDYKNKFLFIYGNVSSGKTSLAEILLKEITLTVTTRTSGVITESEMMDKLIPLINMARSLPSSVQVINK